MTGYVAFGDDGFVDARPIVSKEKKDSGPGFFKSMGRAISPNTRSGRSNLASRSFVGPLSSKKRPPSIYDKSQNTVQVTNQAQWNAGPEEKEEDERILRAQMQDYYGNKEAESMKKAKEMYAEEVENAKKEEKAEKKRKSKCKNQLKFGCMLNCNKPTGNQIDCKNCVNKHFDMLRTPGKTKCRENEISHYLDTHIMGLRENRIFGKAREEQAPMQTPGRHSDGTERVGYEMGTYGDNLLQEAEHYRSNPGGSVRMTEGSAYDIRSRLGDRVGTDYLGNLSPRKLKERKATAPPPSSLAMGGARRRRRTNRRKPKKSKKSKRTRRTRRR